MLEFNINITLSWITFLNSSVKLSFMQDVDICYQILTYLTLQGGLIMILFCITVCIHSVDGIDVRPADPNVIALRLNWLETDPNIHSGDPVRCTNTNCGVVLSCTSKLAQEKDQQVNYCLNAVHNHCCSVSGRFSFIHVMKGQKQYKIYLVVIKKVLHTFFQT